MNTTGVIAFAMIASLVGFIVFARGEISADDYAKLVTAVASNEDIVHATKDALKDGKVSRIEYHIIMIDSSASKDTAAASIAATIQKNVPQPTTSQQLKEAVLAALNARIAATSGNPATNNH